MPPTPPREEPAASDAVERLLGASRLFGALDAPLRHALARTAGARVLGRGDLIWRAGEPATRFTLIRRGLAKIVQPGGAAGESIVGLFGPRETIGDPAVLARG